MRYHTVLYKQPSVFRNKMRLCMGMSNCLPQPYRLYLDMKLRDEELTAVWFYYQLFWWLYLTIAVALSLVSVYMWYVWVGGCALRSHVCIQIRSGYFWIIMPDGRNYKNVNAGVKAGKFKTWSIIGRQYLITPIIARVISGLLCQNILRGFTFCKWEWQSQWQHVVYDWICVMKYSALLGKNDANVQITNCINL